MIWTKDFVLDRNFSKAPSNEVARFCYRMRLYSVVFKQRVTERMRNSLAVSKLLPETKIKTILAFSPFHLRLCHSSIAEIEPGNYMYYDTL